MIAAAAYLAKSGEEVCPEEGKSGSEGGQSEPHHVYLPLGIGHGLGRHQHQPSTPTSTSTPTSHNHQCLSILTAAAATTSHARHSGDEPSVWVSALKGTVKFLSWLVGSEPRSSCIHSSPPQHSDHSASISCLCLLH